MKSKIFGLPLVLILLVLGIIIPICVFVYALHVTQMMELKRLQPVTVVKTVERQVVVTPTIKLLPTPIKKQPVSSQSAHTK